MDRFTQQGLVESQKRIPESQNRILTEQMDHSKHPGPRADTNFLAAVTSAASAHHPCCFLHTCWSGICSPPTGSGLSWLRSPSWMPGSGRFPGKPGPLLPSLLPSHCLHMCMCAPRLGGCTSPCRPRAVCLQRCWKTTPGSRMKHPGLLVPSPTSSTLTHTSWRERGRQTTVWPQSPSASKESHVTVGSSELTP